MSNITTVIYERTNMFSIFKNKKKENELLAQRVNEKMELREKQIAHIKAEKLAEARELTKNLRDINRIVKEHGATGVIFVALGGRDQGGGK